ncbi:hypothetical protein BDZ89DRAFT_295071 [Hymenopellis radicata]|nr:hypothetical protein BDZ89DRAFT_295071 [Hymenopellis radicata]
MDGGRTSMLTTKGWSLPFLLSMGKRFRPVPRISAFDPALQARLDEYETRGEPLVVDSFQEHGDWPNQMFNVDYFQQHIDQTSIGVRDIHSLADHIVTFDDFIGHYKDCAPFVAPGETKRWYGKDAQCPQEWCQWLHCGVLPSRLTPESPQNLLNCLPEDARVETLMCYLGIGDTFTPAHKDLCASFGQNLMSYTENDGCSFWFMTRSADIGEVTKYFHHLGHELDHELHAVTLEELSEAPFDVYIVQQKLGDLVLVPPRSCHQVVNYGGITLKTSWSRMTLSGLSVALAHELPIYQRACRLETYRIKLVVYHALRHFTDSLTSTNSEDDASKVFALMPLYDHILKLEAPPVHFTSLTLLRAPVSDLTCDFCGADIFQSFFECRGCIVPVSGTSEESGDGLTLCPACYIDGRQCLCPVMRPMQIRDFEGLLHDRRRALEALEKYSHHSSKSPLVMQSEGSLLLDPHQRYSKPVAFFNPGVRSSSTMVEETLKQRADLKYVPCAVPKSQTIPLIAHLV